MNRTALSLVALAVLTSAPAFADHFEHGARPAPRFEGREYREWNRRPVVTFGPMYRGPVNAGHYELRDVQRWVDGQWSQVWVNGTCTLTPWGPRCSAAGYQNVWQPGHYVTTQERVFVPVAYGPSVVELPAPAVVDTADDDCDD